MNLYRLPEDGQATTSKYDNDNAQHCHKISRSQKKLTKDRRLVLHPNNGLMDFTQQLQKKRCAKDSDENFPQIGKSGDASHSETDGYRDRDRDGVMGIQTFPEKSLQSI